MAVTNSSNMGLPIPGVGTESGPNYASDINASLTLVDQHDHSIGKGVQITPAGMNINSALSFAGNFATGVAGVTFSAQGSTPGIGTVYESGNDLYFVDGVGNNVRITQSGAVAGTPGSISNLVAPASAAYVGASSKFVWQSNTNVSADMDAGSLIIREKVASAKGITIASPSGLASDYALTLMGALPASQKFATIDNSGSIAANWAVDNSTIEVASNVVQVKDGGITKPKLAALGQQLSSSSGSFSTTSNSLVDVTNLTVTITTTGRPVMLMLLAANGATNSIISTSTITAANATGEVQFYNTTGATALSTIAIGVYPSGTQALLELPPSSFIYVDTPAAGTISYKIRTRSTNGTAVTMTFLGVKLIAYEI